MVPDHLNIISRFHQGPGAKYIVGVAIDNGRDRLVAYLPDQFQYLTAVFDVVAGVVDN